MKNTTGVDLELKDGEDINIKGIDIEQGADKMENVTGFKIKASGRQSARLQGITAQQPHAKVVISDDPRVKVIVNKRT